MKAKDDEEGYTSALNLPAIVDQMTVEVTNVKLGRASDIGVDYREEMDRTAIFKTENFNGTVERNLSSWCVKIPDINVSTELDALRVRVCVCVLECYFNGRWAVTFIFAVTDVNTMSL